MSATHGKSFSYELGDDEIEGFVPYSSGSSSSSSHRHTATESKPRSQKSKSSVAKSREMTSPPAERREENKVCSRSSRSSISDGSVSCESSNSTCSGNSQPTVLQANPPNVQPLDSLESLSSSVCAARGETAARPHDTSPPLETLPPVSFAPLQRPPSIGRKLMKNPPKPNYPPPPPPNPNQNPSLPSPPNYLSPAPPVTLPTQITQIIPSPPLLDNSALRLLFAAAPTSTAHKEPELPAFRAQALARYLGSRRLPPRQPGQAVVVTHAVVEELMIAGRRPDTLPSVLLTVSECAFEATDTSELGLSATLQKTHRDTGRVPSASEANVVLPLLQISHVLVDQVYTRILALISAESAATRYSTSHCHLYLFPSAHEAQRFSQDFGTAFSKLAAHIASSPVTPSPAPAPRLIASSSSTSRSTSKVGNPVGTRPISTLHAETNLPPHLSSVVRQSIPLPPTPPEQLQMQREIQRRLQAVRGEPSASSCSSDGSAVYFLGGVQHSGPPTSLSQLTLSDQASSGYGTTESTPMNTKTLGFVDAAGAACNAGRTDAENSSVPSTPPPPYPSRPPPSCKHLY